MIRHALVLVTLLALALTGMAAGQQSGSPPPLNPVGVTGHAWGAWVRPETKIEDWVEMAKGLCQGEDLCEVNVFEGPELATHEVPVPEENRKALKFVFTYRHGQSPPVVVKEARAEAGREPRQWTFE